MDIVRAIVFALGLGVLVGAVLRARELGGFPLATLIREWFSPPPSPVSALIAVCAGAACVAAVPLVGLLEGWVRITPRQGLSAKWIGLAAAGVAVKAVFVLFEELIFRGAMVSQLRRWTGPGVAVAVSALAFAGAHGGRAPLDRAVLFADGLGFALAFVLTGSLWVPAIWHTSKNLSVWLLFGHGTIDLAPGPFEFQHSTVGAQGLDAGAGITELVVTVVVVGLCLALLRQSTTPAKPGA